MAASRRTPARPHFTYPLSGDTDRVIHLQIEAALDAEDVLRGDIYTDPSLIGCEFDDDDSCPRLGTPRSPLPVIDDPDNNTGDLTFAFVREE